MTFGGLCERHGLYESRHEKTFFAICEQQRRSLASAFVIRCIDTCNIILLVYLSQIIKPLRSFFCCAGRFVSYLGEDLEVSFSRDEAHKVFQF